MTDKRTITVTVNGTSYTRETPVRITLADFIRYDLKLTGTHVGCEHGVCGACTVLLDGQSARSCLHLAVAVQRHEVTTIEGLDETKAIAHLQEAFQRNHALQCGFCTPGFL